MYVGLFNLGQDDCAFMHTSAARVQAALDPFDTADAHGHKEFSGVRFFQALTYNTSESQNESVPTICPHTGRVITAWVRLDNREELAADLSIDKGQLASTCDPRLILAAYDRWGERCTEHLLGDFSFCIYDPAAKSVFAARDPLGVSHFITTTAITYLC